MRPGRVVLSQRQRRCDDCRPGAARGSVGAERQPDVLRGRAVLAAAGGPRWRPAGGLRRHLGRALDRDQPAAGSPGAAAGRPELSAGAPSLPTGRPRCHVSARNAVGLSVAAPLAFALPPATPPAPVQGLQLSGQALSWAVPAHDGGAAIEGYEVEWTSTLGHLSAVANGTSLALQLVGNLVYTFRVRARNSIGAGALRKALNSAEHRSHGLVGAPGTTFGADAT